MFITVILLKFYKMDTLILLKTAEKATVRSNPRKRFNILTRATAFAI